MKKALVLLFLYLQVAALAQPNDRAYAELPPQTAYALLPDSGYKLQDVLGNNKLPFTDGGVINVAKWPVCWLRIIITCNNHSAVTYSLSVTPALITTFYNADAETGRWVGRSAGILSQPVSGREKDGVIPLLLQPGVNTVYAKMDVSAVRKFGYTIKPAVHIENQDIVDRRQKILWVSWAAGLCVLFVFFINNVYLYHSFRDKAVFYYLIVHIGAMLYLNSYRWGFPLKVFSFWLTQGGVSGFYDLNKLMVHAAILIFLYGFIQQTRCYLGTKKHFPHTDKVLGSVLHIYMATSVVLIAINAGGYNIDHYTLVADNLFLGILMLFIIYTCIMAYLRKLPAAGPFLMANVLPLVFVAGIPIFHVFISFNSADNVLLPSLGVITGACGFSIALVARTKLMQTELKAKEMEAQQLAFELREMELLRSLTELDNQQIKINIEQEKTGRQLALQKLEANQRELASATLYMVQKNELLAALKTQIRHLNKAAAGKRNSSLTDVKSILQSNLYLDDDWGKFKLHFEQVHPRFFEELMQKHPTLTKNETRLYAYFHINLSTKEIASLLNIDPASVRRAKTRLHKKMGHPIPPEEDDGSGDVE